MSQDVIHGLYASWGERDISGELVTANLTFGGNILTAIPWNASLVQSNGGIPDGSASLEGVMTSAQPVQDLVTDAHTEQPWSFAFEMTTFSDTPAEGDFAMFGVGTGPGPQWTAQNGQLSAWSMAVSKLPIFGFVMAYGTKTSSSTGTGLQFTGGVADGQSVYSLLVCDTATSGTHDMILESADLSDFVGATTRITHTQITTTATAELLIYTPAGGQTDDWWRSNWTSATTPSHKIAHYMGIF